MPVVYGDLESTGRLFDLESSGCSVQDRAFGVEIETDYCDLDEIDSALSYAGLRLSNDCHSKDHWNVKDEHCGSEITSPILRGSEGRRQVEVACRALRELGATVDGDCGLHVHHDAQDLTTDEIKWLYRNWYEQEDLINRLVSPRRRGSGWCSRLREAEVAQVEALESIDHVSSYCYFDRERSLNLRSYPRKGSVEVRLHQGTLNARKINSWVMFGQAFIDASRARAAFESVREIHGLLDQLAGYALPEATITYLKQRSAVLA